MASAPRPARMVHMRRQELALELAVAAAAALAAAAVLAAVLLPGPPTRDAAAVFGAMASG
jgi:hypothetical protein